MKIPRGDLGGWAVDLGFLKVCQENMTRKVSCEDTEIVILALYRMKYLTLEAEARERLELGTRVTCINFDCCGGLQLGEKGTVIEIAENSFLVEGDIQTRHNSNWWQCVNCIKKEAK